MEKYSTLLHDSDEQRRKSKPLDFENSDDNVEAPIIMTGQRLFYDRTRISIWLVEREIILSNDWNWCSRRRIRCKIDVHSGTCLGAIFWHVFVTPFAYTTVEKFSLWFLSAARSMNLNYAQLSNRTCSSKAVYDRSTWICRIQISRD